MSNPPFVIPAPMQVSLPVAGTTARFPVRRIFCVGRNYAEHAREMGHDPDAEPPFFFTKPADAVVEDSATVPFPPATDNLHHEAELVVAIGTGGANVAPDDALALVWGYAAGNDLTRRDLQTEAKHLRRPWDMSKGFDRSAVIGLLHRGATVPTGRIRCIVGSETRQDADLSEMIWPVEGIIAHLSRLVTLAPGDLVMTGTPSGVGRIARGETCRVEIDGLTPATVTVA